MSFKRELATFKYRFWDSKIYSAFRRLSKYINRILKRDVCVLCSEFLKRYRNDNRSAELNDPYYVYKDGFLEDYQSLMKRIMKVHFKLTGNTDVIISDAAYGNWEHFWETNEESIQPLEIVFENLCCDIGYCSDRFTWDRFLRINWAYQRVKRRLEDRDAN